MGEMSRVKSRFFPNSLLHSPRLERDGSLFSDLELAYSDIKHLKSDVDIFKGYYVGPITKNLTHQIFVESTGIITFL